MINLYSCVSEGECIRRSEVKGQYFYAFFINIFFTKKINEPACVPTFKKVNVTNTQNDIITLNSLIVDYCSCL